MTSGRKRRKIRKSRHITIASRHDTARLISPRTIGSTPSDAANALMSSSPGATRPVTRIDSCSAAVSHETCRAGPPTLSRAMTRAMRMSAGYRLGARTSGPQSADLRSDDSLLATAAGRGRPATADRRSALQCIIRLETMPPCLICQTPVEPFISFGKMPIANGFLAPEQFAVEHFFDLQAGFCPACTMVQLTELVDREKMFHDNYAFFSSTSSVMARHFAEFADAIRTNYLTSADPFVVELGSNDGIMLQHFASRSIRHLGVEPSANVAAVARDKGINTVSQFFDERLAREIAAAHGPASVIAGANVMCHIPYLNSVIAGMKLLLDADGVVVFEDPYLGDIVEKTSYDQIYDEHALYFSVSSIEYAFRQHGLDLVDVVPQEVHGGSMRYVLAHTGRREPSAAVAQWRGKEKQLGLHRPE